MSEYRDIQLSKTYLFIGFGCTRTCPSCGVLSLQKNMSITMFERNVRGGTLTVPPKLIIDLSKADILLFNMVPTHEHIEFLHVGHLGLRSWLDFERCVLAKKIGKHILYPRTNAISTSVDVIRGAFYSLRPAGSTELRTVANFETSI